MPEFLRTKADFDAALSDAGSKLVVVDFTAAWCGPCKMIAPKFEQMSKDNPDVAFYKVDVDENDETAEANGISAMPTFMFFKDGKKIDSFSGANEARLKEFIDKYK
jgi:thioredoxin